jgi:two-component system sensor histidine kinase TctE
VCSILVAETLGKHHAAQRAVLLASLLGAVALALPMALMAMVAVGRGMRPLRLAATEIASRTPDQLEAIDTRAVPHEVVKFVNALNDLFGRLREVAAAQRAFVADAAHQLRTPLAVLRVEAAQALDSPHPPALRPTLERLHAAAERGARLAQQLLLLARAEATAIDPTQPGQLLDLSRLVTESADRWLQPSIEADQDLGFELAPAWVEGDPLLLTELLGNLVHNAIEHAGSGSRITIRTGMQDGWAQLIVEDDGCGIAPEEQASVWQRFRRGRGARGTGSGLGLAIVKDIAHLHGANATLATGEQGRGLRLCISFPAKHARVSEPMLQ